MPDAFGAAAVVTADFDLVALDDVGNDGGAARGEHENRREGDESRTEAELVSGGEASAGEVLHGETVLLAVLAPRVTFDGGAAENGVAVRSGNGGETVNLGGSGGNW